MNAVCTGIFSDADQVFDVQIGVDRLFAFSDQIGFICFKTVHRTFILLRIYAHSRDSQFSQCTKYTYRDFATICN